MITTENPKNDVRQILDLVANDTGISEENLIDRFGVINQKLSEAKTHKKLVGLGLKYQRKDLLFEKIGDISSNFDVNGFQDKVSEMLDDDVTDLAIFISVGHHVFLSDLN